MASDSAPGAPLAETVVCAPALPSGLEALHGALARFWVGVDAALRRPPDGEHRLRLETAVMEVATNIIRHAHPPGAPRGSMGLRLRAHADRIEARFTDRGLAFRPPQSAPR